MTSGVVSRIEVTEYCNAANEMLGIQIDAAINDGNSGGPAFSEKGKSALGTVSCPEVVEACLNASSHRVGESGSGFRCADPPWRCIGVAFQSMNAGEAENIGATVGEQLN